MHATVLPATYKGHLPDPPNMTIRRLSHWWVVELPPVMVVYYNVNRAAHLLPAAEAEGPGLAILRELGHTVAFESFPVRPEQHGGHTAALWKGDLLRALPVWAQSVFEGHDRFEVRTAVVDGRPAVVLLPLPKNPVDR